MFCFASNSVITRYLVLGDRLSPFALTTVRFVSGLVMLFLLQKSIPQRFQNVRPTKANVLGGLLLGLYAFCISYGYVYISVAAGTLVFYGCVVIAMSLYSYLHDRDMVRIRPVLGQILAFVGIVVITFGKIQSVTSLGVALMACTGISWGLYSVYGRGFKGSFGYTYNSFLIFGLSALVLSPAVRALSPASITFDLSLGGIGLALYMGMISTALSYVLWHKVLGRISSSQGGVSQLIAPIMSSVMGVLLLGEQVTSSLLLGGAAILVGIYFNT